MYEIYPQWVPTFRRGTWLRRSTPDTEVWVRFPVMAFPCNPLTDLIDLDVEVCKPNSHVYGAVAHAINVAVS
jgi:hypothetical protein